MFYRVWKMRIYIPEMDEFFSWMDACHYRYAVLRSFLGLEKAYPAIGDKRDIDMLVDDIAIGAIRAKYGRYKKHSGVKCDFYHSLSSHDGDYLGAPDFPADLAEHVLQRRRKWHGRFYVPSAMDHYASLLYTITYHKAETSGFPAQETPSPQTSKYSAELDMLEAELGLHTPRHLSAFHAWLKEKSWGVSYARLARNIQNNHVRGRNSDFLKSLCHEWPQSMGIFMIGKAFYTHKKMDYILQHIRKKYQLIEVKPITATTRLRLCLTRAPECVRRAHAVAVFLQPDGSEPPEDFTRLMQQFLGWAIARDPSHWPLSATQNEEQAISLLPFFFTEKERDALYKKRSAANS